MSKNSLYLMISKLTRFYRTSSIYTKRIDYRNILFFYLNYLDKWIELCMNKWMGWSLFCYISEDKVLDYTGHRFASCGTCCLEARL